MGELQDQSRERIHQCTLAEIEHSGIVGLRVANIAEAANVSVALIYKYYKDREGLLAGVLSKEIENYYLNDVQNIRRLVESSEQISIDLLMTAFPMPEDQSRLKRRALRIQIFAASEEIPELRKGIGEAQKTIHEEVRKLIIEVRNRAGAKNLISADVISFVVQAMGFSFGFNDFMDDKPLNNDNYSEFMRDFLSRYLLT